MIKVKDIIFSIRGPYSYLSRYSPHSFLDAKGLMWSTVEHYYQAMKFEGVDAEYLQRIRSTKDPQHATLLGESPRTKKGIREDWEFVRCAILHTAVVYKFTQNILLWSQLMETSPHRLVEGDYIPSESATNTHGIILMDLREYRERTREDL